MCKVSWSPHKSYNGNLISYVKRFHHYSKLNAKLNIQHEKKIEEHCNYHLLLYIYYMQLNVSYLQQVLAAGGAKVRPLTTKNTMPIVIQGGGTITL